MMALWNRGKKKKKSASGNRERVLSLPHGSMIHAVVDFGGGPEAGLLVRERREVLTSWGGRPRLEFRSGELEYGDVPLIFLLMMVGEGKGSHIYDTWFDAATDPVSRNCLVTLTGQDTIRVAFFDEELERMLDAPNQMSDFFCRARDRFDELERWSGAQFEAARSRLFETLPTTRHLWDYVSERNREENV